MLNYIWAVMILIGIVYGALTGHMEAVTNGALDSAGEAVSLCITMAGVMALWMGLMEIATEAGIVEKLTKGIRPFLRFLFPDIPEGHPALSYIATNMIANVLGLGWACTPAGLKAMEALADLERERGNPAYAAPEKIAAGGENGKPELAGRRENLTGQEDRRAEQAGMKENLTGREDKRRELTGRRENLTGREDRKRELTGRGERIASKEMCHFLILNISSLQLIPVNMIAYRQQYGSSNPSGIIAPAIAATTVSTLTAVVFCKMMDKGRKRDRFEVSDGIGMRKIRKISKISRNGQGAG